MTTEAQIKANQENAQKSTGPTSVEGKKKSSMNAITHGIFSNIAILPGFDKGRSGMAPNITHATAE
jgi:hypothetical protein